MMDESGLPEGFEVVVQPEASVAQPTADVSQEAPQMQENGLPEGFQIEGEPSEKELKHGTTSEMIKTGLEGAAKGVLGPIAPFIEKQVFHVKPSEMLAREEVNPVTHAIGEATGLGASLWSGVGLGGVAAKAGAGVAELAGLGKAAEGLGILGKIGGEAIDQATQMALIQGSDEVSKMILNDPKASAENAMANVGLATAMGGLTGAAIGSISPLWKASGIGDKAGKLFNEMKDELNFIQKNPDVVSTAAKELEDLHGSTQVLSESLRANGLKGDMIRESLPELNEKTLPKLHEQISNIRTKLSDTAESLLESHDTKAAAPYIEQRLKDFEHNITKANSAEDAYNAINDLKKELQGYAQKGRAYGSDMNTSALGEVAAKLGSEIKPMLEDTAVWGKAGQIQKDFNAAFTDFKASKASEDFLKTFTREVGGERVMDPGKINTFINQAGKPNAEIKSEILKNYIEENSKFADKVNGLMASMGKDPLVQPQSLNVLHKLMGEQTEGAKLVQKLVNKVADNAMGKAAAAGLGGTLGGFAGHPVLGALVGEHMLGSTFGSVLNGLTKSIIEKDASGMAAKSAFDYALLAAKGQKIMNTAVSNVLKPGAQVLGTHLMPDAKDREKLDKIVTKYQENPTQMTQIDNGRLGHYLPDHQTSLTQSTMQAAAYLAQIKPQPYRSSPLDKEIQPTDAQMQRYDRALNIAQQPAIVLQHIKEGTLQASDVQDLHNMYPAVYSQMVNKLNQEMINKVDEGHLIPYKTRMSMSLFIGQPLDSSMQPQSILAAQPHPNSKPGAQGGQQPMKNRKGTNSLGKSNSNYMTPGQGAEKDRSNRD